jgi:hypothetical protein
MLVDEAIGGSAIQESHYALSHLISQLIDFNGSQQRSTSRSHGRLIERFIHRFPPLAGDDVPTIGLTLNVDKPS